MFLSRLEQLQQTLTRRKQLEADLLATPLKRCLNLFDVSLLGIGHMVGAGIYVVTGAVAKNVAGPGVVLSYLFAAVAAILSSLCYAEFGARAPKAGSAYTYTYVMMGEVFAFFIGWNMILEYLIGSASIARAFSGSIDALFNGAIRNATVQSIGSIHAMWISEYLDFTAVFITLFCTVFIAAGAKVSTTFNSVLTIINLSFLLIIIAFGFCLSDVTNWTDTSTGGFLPFGFSGVIAGAGSCFYAYIGFEGIAVAGEETVDPARTIPRATGLAMSVVSSLYVATAAVLTLMLPWSDIDVSAPFPDAFARHGFHLVKYLVAAGSAVGISTSLLGSLFAMPRCVYSMASDGLLFRSLSTVNGCTQTPVYAIVLSGLLTAVFALLLDIEVLVERMSIGTLFSFTFVALSVIILHYQPVEFCQFAMKTQPPREEETTASAGDIRLDAHVTQPSHTPAAASDNSLSTESIADEESTDAGEKRNIISRSQSRHEDIGRLKRQFSWLPDVLGRFSAGSVTLFAVVGMTVFMVAMLSLVLHGTQYLTAGSWWSIVLLLLFIAGLVLCFLVLLAHERNDSFVTFQVPLSPLLPAQSVMCNVSMMLLLNHQTWLRLTAWIAVGLIVYASYSVWHSNERFKTLLLNGRAQNTSRTSYNTEPSVESITPDNQRAADK